MVSDMVDDNIDTVGKAFLGVSLGCARCHDHKFDPIANEDYYALAGIFYSSHFLKELGTKGGEYTVNRVPLVPKSVVARRDEQVKQLNETIAKLAELEKQKQKPAGDDRERLRLVARRDKLRNELPPEPPLAMAMQEGGTPGGLFPRIQDVPIHIRGSYTRLGAVVARRLPRFLAGESQPAIVSGSGRRELAGWVASKKNPLTARVIVNRVWQWHFGDGLVRTPSNFGLRSEPPTHPALLDWLAARFVADGWSAEETPSADHAVRPYTNRPVSYHATNSTTIPRIAGSAAFRPGVSRPRSCAMPCCRSPAVSIRHRVDQPAMI